MMKNPSYPLLLEYSIITRQLSEIRQSRIAATMLISEFEGHDRLKLIGHIRKLYIEKRNLRALLNSIADRLPSENFSILTELHKDE